MAKTPHILIRVDDARRATWTEAASRDDAKNLSEWIRERLDEAAAGPSALVELRKHNAELAAKVDAQDVTIRRLGRRLMALRDGIDQAALEMLAE